MRDVTGANKMEASRKHVAVLAFFLVAVNAALLMFAVSGTIDYFVAYGIIPITFLLCALALLVIVAKSRRRA